MTTMTNNQGERENSSENSPARETLVVGIGASAGGFDTFQTFLKNLPTANGMAFVYVSHFDPTHESLMPGLLSRITEIPVQQIKNSTKVKPGNIYIIPPDKTLTIKKGVLKLEQPKEKRGLRLPIDAFFHSLGEDQKENAVGIILSGSGSDGAIGVKTIKENGGVIFVQDSKTAKFDGMPRSAILTGIVDYIYPVEELAVKLAQYAEHREILQKDNEKLDASLFLDEICAILRERTGNDFSKYKRSTLTRRIQRRMQVVQSQSVADYVVLIRADAEETVNLFKDLLIGVTHFFRDREAFETLEREVIPQIFGRKNAEDAIRVWTAGCATGEEAYSLAILLREGAETLNLPNPIQIFATDIDEDALDYARRGRYPESVAEQIPPEYLAKYFTKTDGYYQISKELREMCLFSSHNLIKHPPFSRLDLISCRNLLIYLDTDLHKTLLPIFHYALAADGFLFLGASENLAGQTDLFRTIDKSNRIFQAKEAIPGSRSQFPLIQAERFSQARRGAQTPKSGATGEVEIGKLIEKIMLDDYAPACVIVNSRYEIVYFFGRTGKYLEPATGIPSSNLLELARKGLRLDLRTALHKAAATVEAVTHENITFETGEATARRINLKVRPISEFGADSNLFLVVFQDVGEAFPIVEIGAADAFARTDNPLVKQIEDELLTMKEHLQTTIEELETSNEELKSSNEELLSMNEEMQSANEELQTSKEEMQSINEEIETVNAELRNKIEEIDQANSDLQNFFQSTNIATIFLDRNLRIKKFTPATTQIFELIETDLGRSLTSILPLIEGVDLLKDVEECLRTLKISEREMRLTNKEQYFMMRIAPYRTIENMINGVVLTFFNITEIQRARSEAETSLTSLIESKEMLRRNHETFFNLVQNTPFGIYIVDSEFRLVQISAGSQKVFANIKPLIGRDFAEIMRTIWEEPFASEVIGHFRQTLATGEPYVAGSITEKRGDIEDVESYDWKIERIVLPDGQFGVVCYFYDLTELRQAEDALRESEVKFRAMAETVPNMLFTVTAEGTADYANEQFAEFVGIENIDLTKTELSEFIHPEDHEETQNKWREALTMGKSFEGNYRLLRNDGEYRWFIGRAVPIRNEDGKILRWFGSLTEIEEMVRAQNSIKEADRRKDEFMAMLGHELRNPLAPLKNSLTLLQNNLGDAQFQKLHNVMNRQVEQMCRLVDDLLDVSRISHNKIQIKREPLELGELMRNLENDLQTTIESRALTLEANLPTEKVWVSGDTVRLTQAIGNIINNAAKFSNQGGTIYVNLKANAEKTTLTIKDEGIGMKTEAVERIFDSFTQEDNSLERTRGGLGLGLSLAKGLLEMHGGTITAASAGENKGSQFTVELPRIAAPRVEIKQPEKAETNGSGNRRILVIEDNADSAETLKILLEMSDYKVETSPDGKDGIRQSAEFAPEIIICDIGLPGGMNGYDVVTELKKDARHKNAYFVALSGYGQPEDKEKSAAAGFDEHLVKPVDFDVLIDLLGKIKP